MRWYGSEAGASLPYGERNEGGGYEMDTCDHCGLLFLTMKHSLLLVELVDACGVWQEWLCTACVDDALDHVDAGCCNLTGLTVYGFDLDALG